MIEMNPYYAHDSSVGHVFDVATWSTGRCRKIAVIASIVVLITGTSIAFLINPSWFMDHPREEPGKGFYEGIVELHEEHFVGLLCAVGILGLFGWMSLAMAVTSWQDSTGDYFLRVGPEGVTLRLPHGLVWSRLGMVSDVFEMEVSWDDVEELCVISERQLGALSRNAGNLGASIRLRLTTGKKHQFDVSMFSQPGYMIHDRINEATRMVPASMDQDSGEQPVPIG